MRENFERALALVLVHEGGWSDHPADPGGATMKGVTLAAYREFFEKPNATKTELRNITDAQLRDIYRRRYWNAVRGDDLPSGIDYAVFDFAVNSGPGRAARFLQRLVGAAQDGAVGDKTLRAVNAHPQPAGLISDLCKARGDWLKTLSTYSTFGRGWARRVQEVERDALAMRGVIPATQPDAATVVAPGAAAAGGAIALGAGLSGNSALLWIGGAVIVAAIAFGIIRAARRR